MVSKSMRENSTTYDLPSFPLPCVIMELTVEGGWEHLDNPPELCHFELIIDRRERIHHILHLFALEWLLTVDGLAVIFRGVDRGVELVGQAARFVVYRFRARFDDGI